MSRNKFDITSYMIGKNAGGGGGGDEPTGTIDITSNGIHNVKKYAEAKVQVPGPSGTKQVTISDIGTISEDVTNYAEAEITTSGLVKPSGNKSITVDTPGTISDIDVSNFATVSVSTDGLVETPSGSIDITSNGTIDVSEYEEAIVNVPSIWNPSTLTLWENPTPQTYPSGTQGYDFEFDTSKYTHIVITTKPSSGSKILSNFFDLASITGRITSTAGTWENTSTRSVAFNNKTNNGLRVEIYSDSNVIPQAIYAIDMTGLPF